MAGESARERRRSAVAVRRQRCKRIPLSSESGSQDSDRHVKTCTLHAVKYAGGRLDLPGWQGLLGKAAGGCWKHSGRVGERAVAGPLQFLRKESFATLRPEARPLQLLQTLTRCHRHCVALIAARPSCRANIFNYSYINRCKHAGYFCAEPLPGPPGPPSVSGSHLM